MEAWEFAISTYLHSSKIDNVTMRRGILGQAATEEFIFMQISEWAKEKETYAEWCYIYELDLKNSC